MALRKFQIVGTPFYTVEGVKHRDTTAKQGDIVTLAGALDMDGDIEVRDESGGVIDAVSLTCLVEIDEDGYALIGVEL